MSARDIRTLCDLYEVDDDQRQHLTELAREGKQRAWRQPLRLPYTTYIGLEAEAASISDYGLGILPGLLQTADYARAVVQAAVPKWEPDVAEQRVAGRMARQQLLFSENPLIHMAASPDITQEIIRTMIVHYDAQLVWGAMRWLPGQHPTSRKW